MGAAIGLMCGALLLRTNGRFYLYCVNYEYENIGMGSIPGGKQPRGILVCDTNRSSQHGANKRKTDTVRLL